MHIIQYDIRVLHNNNVLKFESNGDTYLFNRIENNLSSVKLKTSRRSAELNYKAVIGLKTGNYLAMRTVFESRRLIRNNHALGRSN